MPDDISKLADELLEKVLSEDGWSPVPASYGYRTDVQKAWRPALKAAIIAKINELRSDGVEGMGWDNFLQVLRIPPGGPSGTNARYFLKQTIGEIVKELGPAYQRFFLSQ